MHAASENNQLAVLTLLLKRGGNVNATDVSFRSSPFGLERAPSFALHAATFMVLSTLSMFHLYRSTSLVVILFLRLRFPVYIVILFYNGSACHLPFNSGCPSFGRPGTHEDSSPRSLRCLS